jgi:predicted DNA-binding transcriptional regulator AlpA
MVGAHGRRAWSARMVGAHGRRAWSARMVGAHVDPIEFNLRAKLALETRIIGCDRSPFGLDKLSTAEGAAYLGLQEQTLHDRHKRRALGIPEPYHIGRKLFWRRSEIDAWIELQRASQKQEAS